MSRRYNKLVFIERSKRSYIGYLIIHRQINYNVYSFGTELNSFPDGCQPMSMLINKLNRKDRINNQNFSKYFKEASSKVIKMRTVSSKYCRPALGPKRKPKKSMSTKECGIVNQLNKKATF